MHIFRRSSTARPAAERPPRGQAGKRTGPVNTYLVAVPVAENKQKYRILWNTSCYFFFFLLRSEPFGTSTDLCAVKDYGKQFFFHSLVGVSWGTVTQFALSAG